MKTNNFFFGTLSLSVALLYFNGVEVQETIVHPFKEKTQLEIQLISAEVIGFSVIGHEWTFHSEINDSVIEIGKSRCYDLSGKKHFLIKSVAIEHDDSDDDIGKGRIIISSENLKELLEKEFVKDTVIVREFYGKGANQTASCEFVYSIKEK